MSTTLYNRDILRLAASLIPDDRLPAPDGVAEARSPVCGSRIRAEVSLTPDDAIAALALRASACALGQASAAILRQNAVGSSIGTIKQVRKDIVQMLTAAAPPPTVWPDLALLAPAHNYVSRHAAILLPFDALLSAVDNARVTS